MITLAQVREAISGRDEFSVMDRGSYVAVDYNYVLPDSFEGLRSECRGIKFAPDGTCIARPFAKFHNLGEKPHTMQDALPWNAPHVVLEKLDGSMVHPMVVDGEILWCTRAGVTEVSLKAPITTPVAVLAEESLERGLTPIFEYIGPSNRIVLRYDTDDMILTGIRNIETGALTPYYELRRIGQHYGVPVVNAYGSNIVEIASFLEHTRNLKDAEGYVVRWHDGGMVKIKAEDYVLRHRSKDSLAYEKNVLQLIIGGLVDDTVPMLSPEDAAALLAYEKVVRGAIDYWAGQLADLVRRVRGDDPTRWSTFRKTFALDCAPHISPLLRPAAWAIWDGTEPHKAVADVILRHTGSQSEVDVLRAIMPQSWTEFYVHRKGEV